MSMRVRLGHWAMSAECPVFPRADIGRRTPLEKESKHRLQRRRLHRAPATASLTTAQLQRDAAALSLQPARRLIKFHPYIPAAPSRFPRALAVSSLGRDRLGTL